jgi:hypothetical protein
LAVFDEDSAQLRKQQRFHHEVEVAIRDANRKAIHERIPDLDRQKIVAFATFVAQLRADYLAAALAVQALAGTPRKAAIEELRLRRRAFAEARDAFIALERAVERGYVDVA